jgi:pyridoxal phosphate enzyme (YggS family)
MINENLTLIRKSLSTAVTLVCVSKFHDEKAILEAYNAGERVFGESKVQELVTKYEHLPSDIQWHFIGHLQTNKVKQLVPFVSLIHGVDSLKLLEEINKQAEKADIKVKCLLQVHIAREETKFGFSPDELKYLFESNKPTELNNVRICGLMGMATFTDDTEQVRAEFRFLKNLFDDIKQKHTMQLPFFQELSMGMSDDYPIAVEEGSTMVRIGSKIFGQRIYP